MACSAAAMLAASRLNRGYIDTLEKSLLNRAVELDLSDVEDATSRTLMLRTLGVTRSDFGLRVPDDADRPGPCRRSGAGGRSIPRSRTSCRCGRATASGWCRCCAAKKA